MTQPVSTYTVGDVVTFVKRQFGDESGVQIEDSDIFAWINQAATDLVAQNGIIEATASSSTTPGVNAYDMPLDISRIQSVEFNGKYLTNVSRDEISQYGYTNEANAATGNALYWYQWANKIYIYPVPTVPGTLTIFYTANPVRVSSITEQMPLPDMYFEGLSAFVLAKAYELDEDLDMVRTQMEKYKNALANLSNAQYSAGGSYPVISEYGYE